jgi:predicted acylesterase/phospholipase RssA
MLRTVFFTLLFLSATSLLAKDIVPFSAVISGGVSLGAYESGYNWTMIRMLSKLQNANTDVQPELKAVAGASAGSINALLTAMYWCQRSDIAERNSVEDNLFFDTWVNLGIEDLIITGKDKENKSSLFTRRGLKKKARKILEHFKRPIYRPGCEVAFGVSVTKATPMIENISGIEIKNQHFSVPFTIYADNNGRLHIKNRPMPPSTDFYIAIPGIEKKPDKIIDVLFASSAFPGAFEQVKLDYIYKGKRASHYFIDGGAYDNIPLQLAIELDKNASLYLFIDPGHMRKEPYDDTNDTERKPVGFLSTNTMPLLTSLEIFQQMRLYQAINIYFRNNPDRTLILSSRYHPLTGKYLEHFAAFLDRNFRLYDYHVGVYDAIYHLAGKLKTNSAYADKSRAEIMSYLVTLVGIDKHDEALRAYKLFFATEFQGIKPISVDRYSDIYNAFDHNVTDAKRYDFESFKRFLSRLNLHYLPTPKKSFLRYAKRDVNNWYRKPLRMVVNRIVALEYERARIDKTYRPFATAVGVGSWVGSTFTKEKDGWDILPLNFPRNEGEATLRAALRMVPNEISADLANGGLSLGYRALYYGNWEYLSGFEAKANIIFSDDSPDFLRTDLNLFYDYNDMLTFGGGASFFGNFEGSFYQRDNAFGANAYIDLLDIFRFTYVRRQGDRINNNAFYFGIENIPTLLYRLKP